MIHDTQNAQISQKQNERNVYAIRKTMCPPGYHHNGFVVTHELGHKMYGYTLLISLFSWLHIYYAHLAYVRFEHSVCRRSFITTYIYIYIYIYTCRCVTRVGEGGRSPLPFFENRKKLPYFSGKIPWFWTSMC